MKPSEKINLFLPIVNWSWWQIFLGTFIICWLIIRILKGFEPLGWESPLKKGGRPIWWSGFYGDLFLPVGVTASLVSIKYLEETGKWYSSVFWNVIGVVLGFIVIIFIEARGNYTKKQLLAISKLWHTFVSFPFMFYLAFISLVPLVITHRAVLVMFAIIGYGGWLITYIHDMKYPPDYKNTH